ncbi:MAG: response regulator [Candidatus Eisenbacteria bacterium]|nr:response regulator [Candidatus Eisenbacteria bacterium]
MRRARVLVIDDEPLVRRSTARLLEDHGYEVVTATCAQEGLARFESTQPEVVILDVRLPDGSGLELLPRLQEIDPAAKIVVITAFGKTSEAVRAMKLGAADFLKKPYDIEELLHAVSGAAKQIADEKRLDVYRKRERVTLARSQMIGRCAAMQAVRELVRKVAVSETTTVLVTGESGTGKELLARAVHHHSARRDAPLMEINCSTFQEALLENELFGHEKGAYTGADHLKRGLVELCDGGTLFLDEVSEMPPRVQAKLLRFIDNTSFKRVGGNRDITVDIRLIAATNQDLEAAIAEQRFRQDLYFRLKVVSIHLPPLRERDEDILLLASRFLERFSEEFRKDFRRISPAAAEQLLRYPWPGNVRELQNVLERIVLLEEGPELLPRHLPPEVLRRQSGTTRRPSDAIGADAAGDFWQRFYERCCHHARGRLLKLRALEEIYIDLVLSECEDNRSRTARLLGVSRQGLLDRLRRMAESRRQNRADGLPAGGPVPSVESTPSSRTDRRDAGQDEAVSFSPKRAQ